MNALEKILATNSRQEVFSPPEPAASPEKNSTEKNSLPALSPCHACHGIVFWESIYRDGVFRCEVCEPPPSARMIGRRVGVGDRTGHEGTHPGGIAGPEDATGGAKNVTGAAEPNPDSPEAREARLLANQASGNVTGNDWADARRRGRLSTLAERGFNFDDDGNPRMVEWGYGKYFGEALRGFGAAYSSP